MATQTPHSAVQNSANPISARCSDGLRSTARSTRAESPQITTGRLAPRASPALLSILLGQACHRVPALRQTDGTSERDHGAQPEDRGIADPPARRVRAGNAAAGV